MSPAPAIDDESLDETGGWRSLAGVFVLVMLRGRLADTVRAIQERFDPRLAAFAPPHLTLIGSSGAGPIAAATPVPELREALVRVAARSRPMTLSFGPPQRFVQTNTIVLPLDPHGPLRELHERLRQSGLSMAPSRHAFTPHVTLSHYRTLAPGERRELLQVRVTEALVVDHLACSLTEQPLPPRTLFEVGLGDPEHASTLRHDVERP
jgi:2'-5' RNA ligase